MMLKAIHYDRQEFYSYRADHAYQPAAAVLGVDIEADHVVEDLRYFDYVGAASGETLAISRAALDIMPYRFFAHLHLCRILYPDTEITLDGDFFIRLGRRAPDELIEDVKKIIDAAGDRQLFRKDVLDPYFDLFNLALNKDAL